MYQYVYQHVCISACITFKCAVKDRYFVYAGGIISITQISESTGFLSVADCISRRHNAIFGHVARLQEDMPTYNALCCQVNLVTNCLPGRTWKGAPSRPRSRRIDQHRNNNTPVANLWRLAVKCGHSGVMLQPSSIT